jgi:uncharacterized protein (TIGR02996 family)
MAAMIRDAAFLTDIRAVPDDDAPRLIYADWLEERGDASRAEFIRVQCELAKTTDAGRRAALQVRERQLLQRHGDAWIDPAFRRWAQRWRFERGFVIWARVEARHWVDGAAAMLRHAPLLRAAHLVGVWNCLPAVAQSPQLALLSELSILEQAVGNEGSRVLASSPRLASLTALRLQGDRIEQEGVQALAASSYLTRLTELSLPRNFAGSVGVRALAASRNLTRLTELDLTGNMVDAEPAMELAASANLARLAWLSLSDNPIGPRGARALATSPVLERLQGLVLRGAGLGDDGARALAEGRWPALRRLYLAHNRIGDAGARALAASPHLAGLDRLELANNPIRRAAAAALRERFGDRVRL